MRQIRKDDKLKCIAKKPFKGEGDEYVKTLRIGKTYVAVADEIIYHKRYRGIWLIDNEWAHPVSNFKIIGKK